MRLVFFLEESSARVFLEGLLPRILPGNISARYLVFEGKQDLEKQLVVKMRGWRDPDAHFIVLRDQDAGPCIDVKRKLVDLCKQAHKPNALVRIACHELESWYLADLLAVEKAINKKGLSKLQNKKTYLDPDAISSAKEQLKRITDKTYQQISGSRAIGPLLDIENKRSRSFSAFISGIRKLIANP